MHKALLAFVIVAWAGPAFAQQCLHGPGQSTEQAARRRDALTAARTINNIEANQPARAQRTYFTHAQLAEAPYVAQMRQSPNEVVRRLSLIPNTDILPGWRLTLDVSGSGYWFMIQDTTDPCGFAFISNQSGLIFTAEPLR